MRKIIAKRLLESKLTLPHSYMAIEIEMDSLMATRAKFNKHNASKVVPVSPCHEPSTSTHHSTSSTC